MCFLHYWEVVHTGIDSILATAQLHQLGIVWKERLTILWNCGKSTHLNILAEARTLRLRRDYQSAIDDIDSTYHYFLHLMQSLTPQRAVINRQ